MSTEPLKLEFVLQGITAAIQVVRKSQIARECAGGESLDRADEDVLLVLAAYAARQLGFAVDKNGGLTLPASLT